MNCTRLILDRLAARLRLAGVVLLLSVGPDTIALSRQEPPPSAVADAPGLDPRFFDLILRTLEQTRDELISVEPGIAPEALRGRLLVEALRLIANVSGPDLRDDPLLSLPPILREDASRLVSLALGDRADSPEPSPGSVVGTIPVRLRPFEELLESYLSARIEERSASGLPELGPEGLELIALDAACRAVCPSNDPRELSAEERDFMIALSRRVAARGPKVGNVEATRTALDDELDALVELLRRKNAELTLAGGLLDLDDRADRLREFGLEQLEAALRTRQPGLELPPSARDRVATLSRLVARGVPLDPDPGPPPTAGTEAGGPPVDPPRLAPIAGLARGIDLGLTAAGADLPTRRQALRRFVSDRLSGDPRPVEGLPAEADRLVESILAGSIEPGGPPPLPVVEPTINVTVPTVTLPVPTVTTPVYVVVPGPRPRWFRPWR